MTESAHVFISYSRSDKEKMQIIVDYLTQHQVRVWVDLNDITPGRQWRRDIEMGIDSASCMIVLLSPGAKGSYWVREEIAYAQDQRKFIIPVLISPGNAVPFGLAGLDRIDMSQVINDQGLSKLLQSIGQVAKHKNRPTYKEDLVYAVDHNPLPNWADLLIRQHLKSVALDLHKASQATWRSSLLWFYGDKWYVASENGSYQDDELRLWLRKGEGFAGKLWEDGLDVPYLAYHPGNKTTQEIKDDLNLPSDSALIIRRMNSIFCFPIFRRTAHATTMYGALSIDSESLVHRPNERALGAIRQVADSLSEFVDYVPMPYKCTRALRDILRVARLVTPIEAPTRAGIHWLKKHSQDRQRDALYLITASERDITPYSTNREILYRGDTTANANNLVWQALINADVRYNVTPDQHGTAIAIPMREPDSDDIIGIFHLECQSIRALPELNAYRPTFQHLIDLAVKVLGARERDWNE